MAGFLDDPEATAEAIDSDGWLHTGDAGFVDGGGNLRIAGRLTDTYICGGLNVYPAEVEQILARMHGVAEVAVIGVPDDRLGEVGRAFIVPCPHTDVDAQAVHGYAREHMADFKRPKSVTLLSSLPRNASGKVVKPELRTYAETSCGEISRPVPRGAGGPPTSMLENWIADVWQGVLGIDRPGRQDRFADLGGDSMAALEFCRRVKDQFGIRISVDKLLVRQTIAALVGDLQRGTRGVRAPVATLRSDGTGPVYLMIPGLAGHAWNFSPLASAIEAPCDVLALSLTDVALDARRDVRTEIRCAALDVVKNHTSTGRPVVLVGYSFGALIAGDLACWLSDHSIAVANLFLLDPRPWNLSEVGGSASEPLSSRGLKSARRFLRALQESVSRTGAMRGERMAIQIDEEVDASLRVLLPAYLQGRIRYRTERVTCLRTKELVAAAQGESFFFASTAGPIDTLVLDVGHVELLRSARAVTRVAQWLGRDFGRVGTPRWEQPGFYPNRSDVPGVRV
jgi:thioesterase domain-containing protein/acyl carrier protein